MLTSPERLLAAVESERPTVWIVDDTPLDAQRAASALEPLANCEIFEHGAALLERIACDGPPDALLLDWKLPELSGPELCRFMRERFDEGALPILLLTVLSSSANLAEALAAGANDFLSKPFEDVELRARVESALRTKRLFARARNAESALDRERVRLEESEAKLKRLSESGIIGILIMDLAGNVLEANATLLDMIGYSRADLAAGRVRMRELTNPDYLSADDNAVRELVEHGTCKRYEKVLERRDGSQVVVLQGAALLGRDTAISYLLDVSEHRSLEADRNRLYEAERRARSDAERASLMKDEFLATVSHELRTPLNAILGWAQLARSKPVGADLTRALETIERNARIQAKLIEDILDISRVVSGKVRLELSDVDLADVVAQTFEAVRPAANAKGIELQNWTAPGAVVLGDASRLQQVVWNLLTNAIKFTASGGWVRTRIERDETRIALVVEDNGRGISADFLPYVFDRFRQADPSTTRSHGGLGLGLAIVQHLTEQHGGRVSATSAGPGHGARFTVELPLRAVEHSEAARVSVASPTPPSISPLTTHSLAGIRVLVVDDEADSRAFLAAVLERHGAEVISSESVPDAFAAFQARCPDVVVTDIAMSLEDGYDLLRRIRALPAERGGRVPAVALTAYVRAEDERRALSEGFQAHLPKPVEVVRVLETVSNLHQRARSGLS
jgi:PAS domain S-box-containing protein